MRRAWLLTWACALAAHPAFAQPDPAVGMLEEASARYRQVRTLCADFEQHLSVPLLGDERTGSGRLCQAQPNLFAMRFTDPAGDVVVVDGEWVWVYQPSLDEKTVLRRAIAQGTRGYDFHREFLEDPGSKYVSAYQGEDEVGGRPTHRIRVVPRSPSGYVAAVLWLDRGSLELRRVRIEDENESVRTVTLDGIEKNGSVPSGWFTFQPPPGAQVITR